jgi:hypothetical protein
LHLLFNLIGEPAQTSPGCQIGAARRDQATVSQYRSHILVAGHRPFPSLMPRVRICFQRTTRLGRCRSQFVRMYCTSWLDGVVSPSSGRARANTVVFRSSDSARRRFVHGAVRSHQFPARLIRKIWRIAPSVQVQSLGVVETCAQLAALLAAREIVARHS